MQDSVKTEEDNMNVLIDSLGKKERKKASRNKEEDLKLVFKKKRETLESLLLELGKDASEDLKNRFDS